MAIWNHDGKSWNHLSGTMMAKAETMEDRDPDTPPAAASALIYTGNNSEQGTRGTRLPLMHRVLTLIALQVMLPQQLEMGLKAHDLGYKGAPEKSGWSAAGGRGYGQSEGT